MKLKILSKRVLLTASFVGFVIFLAFLFYFVPINLTHSSLAPLIEKTVVIKKVVKPKLESKNLPIRLKIPSIKVDAIVEAVGLTPQGAVGVPKGLVNVAWYNQGVRPGEVGSAVIVGHFGYWKNGTLGVFNNLSKLKKGNKIYVKNTQGVTTAFVVREFKIYGQNEIVPDIFFSNDKKAHLNLITCEGIWDKVSQSYSKRLVLFADKE